MKLAEKVIYLYEELPFKKAINPIDIILAGHPTAFQLSTLHDTLLNMLTRYPKKKSELQRRLSIIEPKLRKIR